MEGTISSLVTVTAGLFFSLMFALFIEELVFGALFRLFFGPKAQPARVQVTERGPVGPPRR